MTDEIIWNEGGADLAFRLWSHILHILLFALFLFTSQKYVCITPESSWSGKQNSWVKYVKA